MVERTDMICAACGDGHGHGDTHVPGVGWLHWQCAATRLRSELKAAQAEVGFQETLVRRLDRLSVLLMRKARKGEIDKILDLVRIARMDVREKLDRAARQAEDEK